MPHEPVLTTVVGSYPAPGWLELAHGHRDELGVDDLDELRRDAVAVAVADQLRAGLDVVTDGEQARYDFNLSFYAFLEGIEPDPFPRRRLGPPAHDQRPRHHILGELRAPRGLGVVEELRDVVGEPVDRHRPPRVGRVAVALQLDADDPTSLLQPGEHAAEAAFEGEDAAVERYERWP